MGSGSSPRGGSVLSRGQQRDSRRAKIAAGGGAEGGEARARAPPVAAKTLIDRISA